MLFKTTTLALLLSTVVAIPTSLSLTEPGDDSLVVIDTLQLAEGTLTIFGANPGHNATEVSSEASSLLTRRCGANNVVCDKNHAPALNTCNELVKRIKGSSLTLNSSPRSVCLSRSGGNCCISWASDIGNVRESDLYNAAKKSLDRCVGEKNSGRATDVAINGKCLNQCLSDRATGCK
ncbi:hypothetical protein B0H63DRAFT_445764 [Podospora didyma]|uniref:WD-like domain-containing protein n=1 Tax=Podospora didyma TaxID=330526 RepID=A0AAE0NXW8_9PEZI|nr:hypothetical protein B0H63DRAFT_445764 [Podospora didyma]